MRLAIRTVGSGCGGGHHQSDPKRERKDKYMILKEEAEKN